MTALLERLRTLLAADDTAAVTDGGVAVVESGAGPDAVGDRDGRREADGAERPGADGEEGVNVADDVLLDGLGSPVFMLDASGTVIAWNAALAAVTGVGSDEAVGRADAAGLLYGADRREETLAEKVLAHPERAHHEYDVSLADSAAGRYTDEGEVVDRDGETRYVTFTAQPLYEDGDLVAVVETVEDRTEAELRAESIEAFSAELRDTLEALVAGDLSARVSFADEHDVLDARLVEGTSERLNRTAATFEETAAGVDEGTTRLEASVEAATDAAADIAANVGEQNRLLTDGVSEMQTFSASMEEVAATADEVDAAAEQARDAANDGLDASEDASEATAEVTEIGEDLVESVTDLGERMDDIEAVVEVISDVAEQTNLLALNANIEAARAGKDGDGFAVVAEEVKTLADETRQHTEQITENIDQLQSQTDSTVVAAEQSHQRIDHAADQIDEVLAAFDEIAAAIDQAADGIGEVSRATDNQAGTVEELTATIEDVRERTEATEAAADRIVSATDEQTAAIDGLTASVRDLRGHGGSGRESTPRPE